MIVLMVNIHVKQESVEAFRAAILENARNSIQEAGIARFDVLQQRDDPTRFVLVEAYRDEQAMASHKETAHYAAWRDSVPEMLVEERTRVTYDVVFPGMDGW